MAYPKGQPRPPTNKGIPHSEETKERISESCKKAGMGHWNTGLTRTEEHRRNMSERMKKHLETPEWQGCLGNQACTYKLNPQ